MFNGKVSVAEGMTDPGSVRLAGAAARPDADRAGESALLAEVALILLTNGQTSEATHIALARLGHAFGYEVEIAIAWGVSTIRRDDESGAQAVFTEPSGVDISRVIAAETVVDAVCAGRLGVGDATRTLQVIGTRPPVPLFRFAAMAAAGAAALGVVFGAHAPLTLGLIALLAGAGACLRRALSRLSGNPFLQPFAAALLAGTGGGVIGMLGLDVAQRLVVACPCMVLVPGPHFLNGAIDLVRGRISVGLFRLAFASFVAVAICAGLLIGLAATGTSFPDSGPAHPAPLLLDVVAAGVAVAAYGSFFNMPWRSLPTLIGVGMLAHALHWALLAAGASVQLGALAACLSVGSLIAPIAERLRLPFGASAFACVVSLIPGVFMFQAASDAVAFAGLGLKAPASMLVDLLDNVVTAGLVLSAMGTGLVAPKMILNALWPVRHRPAGADRDRR